MQKHVTTRIYDPPNSKPQSNHDIDSKFKKKTHHTEPKSNLKNKKMKKKNPQNNTNPIDKKGKRFHF